MSCDSIYFVFNFYFRATSHGFLWQLRCVALRSSVYHWASSVSISIVVDLGFWNLRFWIFRFWEFGMPCRGFVGRKKYDKMKGVWNFTREKKMSRSFYQIRNHKSEIINQFIMENLSIRISFQKMERFIVFLLYLQPLLVLRTEVYDK